MQHTHEFNFHPTINQPDVSMRSVQMYLQVDPYERLSRKPHEKHQNPNHDRVSAFSKDWTVFPDDDETSGFVENELTEKELEKKNPVGCVQCYKMF